MFIHSYVLKRQLREEIIMWDNEYIIMIILII